jgi:hypothetical protein
MTFSIAIITRFVWYLEGSKDLNWWINWARDELVRGTNGTVASEREILFRNVPGCEFEVLGSDGSRSIARVYVAYYPTPGRPRHLLYVISARGFGIWSGNRDAAHFLDSFQLDESALAPAVWGNPITPK